jgi:urease accessory protein
MFDPKSKGRLLLRDAVALNDSNLGGVGLSDKTNQMGVFGTLIIYGPLFKTLADFFVRLFSSQPRIGAKNWGGEKSSESQQSKVESALISVEQTIEKVEGLLWTAASVRGFVLVKFGASEIDGARRWLGSMLRAEGSVERYFGRQALICLR